MDHGTSDDDAADRASLRREAHRDLCSTTQGPSRVSQKMLSTLFARHVRHTRVETTYVARSLLKNIQARVLKRFAEIRFVPGCCGGRKSSPCLTMILKRSTYSITLAWIARQLKG